MNQLRKYLNYCLFLLLTISFYPSNSFAQIKDYVVFGSTGVQVGTSTSIVSGKVGSNVLVQSTGTASFGGDIVSKGKVILANSNNVNGNISAANATVPPSSGIIFQAGSNVSITGSVNVNGNKD